MNNPAIVVIAYNRVDSLKRLLNSLLKANYSCAENVTLIVSIDKSDNDCVSEFAYEFKWPFGEKRVVAHDVNLGLKKHVLECGNYVDEFENIIVLEDDLYVSKEFYHYAYKALEFVSEDEKVAGVSLYNHLLNVHVREPFEAINDGYDNYYMQFAQSWGQAYTRKQWHGFMNWMKDNGNLPIEATNVPQNVSSWSDKSWLKYYIKYVIDTDKYFIYPRDSYTTNFGDEGTHAENSVEDLQVSLACIAKNSKLNREYRFATLMESHALYDSFFENKMLEYSFLSEITEKIGVDLYGYKPVDGYRYFISSKSLPCKVIKSFGRKLRPVDANIFEDISGEDFYLYDLSETNSKPVVSDARRVLYNYKALNLKKIIHVLKYRFLKK